MTGCSSGSPGPSRSSGTPRASSWSAGSCRGRWRPRGARCSRSSASRGRRRRRPPTPLPGRCWRVPRRCLTDRLEDAAAALEAPALDDDPEVALWRAALAAAREDWPAGARELARARTVLAGYPAALQVRLGLPAAQAASEAGDHELAGEVLEALAKLDLNPLQRARLDFHRGLDLARQGGIDRADAIWRGLEDDPDYQTRVKAGYFRVQTLLEAGRLTVEEALAKLVPARALWRGHPSGNQDAGRAGPPLPAKRRSCQRDPCLARPARDGADAGGGRARPRADERELRRGAGAWRKRGRRACLRPLPRLPAADARRPCRRAAATRPGRCSSPSSTCSSRRRRCWASCSSSLWAPGAEARSAPSWPSSGCACPIRPRCSGCSSAAAYAAELPPPLATWHGVLQARALAALERPDEAVAVLERRSSRSEQLERSGRSSGSCATGDSSPRRSRTCSAAAPTSRRRCPPMTRKPVRRLAVAYAQQTDDHALREPAGALRPRAARRGRRAGVPHGDHGARPGGDAGGRARGRRRASRESAKLSRRCAGQTLILPPRVRAAPDRRSGRRRARPRSRRLAFAERRRRPHGADHRPAGSQISTPPGA